ncbi:hypothetical protein [Streptomyces sp. RB17]|uniref:hypothetical protein n=1 Tax=Streptomyces sp. RB17 TaxID=2585197 RepID=UPI0012952A21|nr:hypothetical protein [Streptomyces sp. RB17]
MFDAFDGGGHRAPGLLLGTLVDRGQVEAAHPGESHEDADDALIVEARTAVGHQLLA